MGEQICFSRISSDTKWIRTQPCRTGGTRASYDLYSQKEGYFMTDKEQIMGELEKNITGAEERERLRSICDAIFAAYDKGSATAVSEFFQGKANPLKNNFDDAHTRLLKKMGL